MEPIKFLGATVASLNTNLGWNDSPSTLTVTLAEDNGETFSRPAVGSYTTLFANSTIGENWYFGGIIQNWTEKVDQSGNAIFEVTIIDPRELLDGVQIILGGYTGNITVPNVLNVCGYLQYNGIYRFNGYSVKQIKEAIDDLTNRITPYGNKIRLGGVEYNLNISLLPNLPDYYKITDESMSMLDFIRRVCDDTNHDYFFSVIPTSKPTLTLNVISRNIAPSPGSIRNFLNSNAGSVRNAGYEFNNSFTSKFLVGGRISKMYYQFNQGGEDNDPETNPWENSIWQYWGIDSDKNAIIGQGMGDNHTFTLDVSHLSLGIDRYTIDVGELRACLDSKDSWETYLSLNDQNIYKIQSGSEKDFFRLPEGNLPKLVALLDKKNNNSIVTIFPRGSSTDKRLDEESEAAKKQEIEYYHNGVKNPHFGKATMLKINGLVNSYVGAFLYGTLITNNNNSVDNSKLKNLSSNKVVEDQIVTQTFFYIRDKLYTFLRGLAENYYGKQFMVRLPFIISSRDEMNSIYTSYEPAETGFIEEDLFPLAWQNNLLPIPYDKGYLIDPHLMSEDGRLYAYVRFDSIDGYDYSDIPEDCIVINRNHNSVFIRCEVDQKFVYQNYNLLYSPRAIIKLPGRVTKKYDSGSFSYHALAAWIYPTLSENKPSQAGETIYDLISKQAGSDNLNLYLTNEVVGPALTSIPLLSHERYGPWYATGAEGKTEYEEDESLVPWNFGSWDELNMTAKAKILNSISNYQISEFGSISVPGIPSVLLGQALSDGGPSVTNISINYADEFTTTYNMSTWPVNPYKLSKNRNDYISRLRQKQLELKKNFLEQKEKKSSGMAAGLSLVKTIADIKKNASHGIHSSHDIIFGEKIDDNYHVVIQPTYNTIEQLTDKKQTVQAVSSINNFFIPFGGEMQKVQPVAEENQKLTPNGEKLFPYKKDSKTNILTSTIEGKNTVNTGDPGYDWDNIRGFALRGPLMLSSWGYDIAGFPVPGKKLSSEKVAELMLQAQAQGSTPEEVQKIFQELLDEAEEEVKKEFHEDYLDPTKSEWPTAPIDFRWDDVRKLWTMGGYSFLAAVEDAGNNERANIGPSLVKCRRYTVSYDQDEGIGGKVELIPTNFIFLAGNFRNNEVLEGSFYLVHNIDGFYVLDTQHTFLDYE